MDSRPVFRSQHSRHSSSQRFGMCCEAVKREQHYRDTFRVYRRATIPPLLSLLYIKMSPNKPSQERPRVISRTLNNNHQGEGMRNNNNKERASRAIHLTKFAHGKSQGTKRAIQKYRDKQQTKFLNKAKILRTYKKTMKKEGYEPGKGASRRRMDDDVDMNTTTIPTTNGRRDEQQNHRETLDTTQRPGQHTSSHNLKTATHIPITLDTSSSKTHHTNHPTATTTTTIKQRKRKMDPFAKARAQSQQQKEEEERMKIQREQDAKNRQKKIAERQVRSKHMRQRTLKTGQPVMKHVIQGMLNKIRKDCT